jgi:hypothetical protein
MSSLDLDRQNDSPLDRVDAESTTELLERRWFAAMAAVESLKEDCNIRLGIVAQAQEAWRRECAQLARIEALRDALGEQLAKHETRSLGCGTAAPREAMSLR